MVVHCSPPKCQLDSKSNTCVLPNPWIAFQRSGLGNGLSEYQRKRAYKQFKNAYVAQTGNDPVAFRAALCLRRPILPPRNVGDSTATVVRGYLADMRERLRRNRVHYTKECNIDKTVLEFFDRMFATKIKGTTLTPCQRVGQTLLRLCVGQQEAKFYTFSKTLGLGLHGFVFQCLYKARERRVVKMMIVGDDDAEVQLTGKDTVLEISERLLQREFTMHKLVMERTTSSSGFRVLEVFGDLALFQPPRFDRKIGVYLMQNLPYATLEQEIGEAVSKGALPSAILKKIAETLEQEIGEAVPKGALPSAILTKIAEIPRVLADLHRHGIGHSDLHAGNIAFPDGNNVSKPYILDFGRTILLDTAFSRPIELSTYCVLEHALVLFSLFHYRPSHIVEVYNAFLGGMDDIMTYINRNRTSPSLRDKIKIMLTPLKKSDKLSEREALLRELLYDVKPFKRRGQLSNVGYLRFVTDL